jgi:hypothetical protein
MNGPAYAVVEKSKSPTIIDFILSPYKVCIYMTECRMLPLIAV